MYQPVVSGGVWTRTNFSPMSQLTCLVRRVVMVIESGSDRAEQRTVATDSKNWQ
ncbi:hypothetical protein B7P43_G18370 [Cryptotermes secundus]|uniref:Uncharacterized protein n=1 Tax=Cryptotermes secundus TaxID=105785 RepID=A0A2J7QSM5_9NEOP|nr:hypothetical protein B7P43_G18370 [Cryptotermes secundus]